MKTFLKRGFGNPVLLIVITVPLLSALVGGVLLTLAHQSEVNVSGNPAMLPLARDRAPLSKTRWRGSTSQIEQEQEPQLNPAVESEAGP